jgi:diguanylate cyclase (GGDEF)-like protein
MFVWLGAKDRGEAMDEAKQKILVVDDSAFSANVLAGILQGEYEVAIAKSGEDCLTYVNENEVDLIFLDVVMPRMDGYEVCRRLKADLLTREIPVVFVSASDEVENQTKGLELGAIDYLVHPAPAAVVRAKAKNYLDIKRQHDLLAKFSFKDALTGIFNRRYLMEYLAKKWKAAFYQHTEMAVLFADVDYFKKYNDFYGHLNGDHCLQQIASLLDSLMAQGAIAARYGGEEFMVIMPNTQMDKAVDLAMQIQEHLKQLKIKHAYSEAAPYVTMSMGIAAIHPSAVGQEKVLIEMADMALYKAKKSGRNTWKCFEKPNFKLEKSKSS